MYDVVGQVGKQWQNNFIHEENQNLAFNRNDEFLWVVVLY